ncbi:MAG: NTP transferase domain-containing protein [Elusimicrobiota bacterium]|nr:MAG: NTP transferase domain-containing protein [Elusimicrobiota bacterium]
MSGAPHILVLAAGGGDRMNTTLAQALQPVFFKPMIRHVLDAAVSVPRRSLGVVAGKGERELREGLRDYEDLQFFPSAKGADAADALLAAAEHLGGGDADVLVLSAGAPLTSAGSIGGLWSRHSERGSDVTVATAEAADARGLPRALGKRTRSAPSRTRYSAPRRSGARGRCRRGSTRSASRRCWKSCVDWRPPRAASGACPTPSPPPPRRA